MLYTADSLGLAQALLGGIRSAGGDVVRCQMEGCRLGVHVRGPVIVLDAKGFIRLQPEFVALLAAEKGPRN